MAEADETLDVELPADLLPAETAPPSETAAAAPAPESEPAPKGPSRVVRSAETEPARRYRGRYEEAERARAAYQAELARLRAEETARTQKPTPIEHPDYDAEPHLKGAFSKYDETVAKRLEQERAAIRQELEDLRLEGMRSRLALTEEAMREKHADYDEVLKRSGVAGDVVLDETGRSRDPFLWRLIFESANPARTAYEYAKGRLTKDIEAEAELRGERRARRETVQELHAAGSRPRTIASLPSSTRTRAGLTREHIAAMGDDQKLKLKREYPQVWEWYLQGA